MKIFKKREELDAKIEESKAEIQQVKKKSSRIEKLSSSLEEHMKENHFGPRLYAQMLQNWK